MPDDNRLKVLFISSEAAPFSKSGGLGDVASALPKELCKRGVDCRVVTPMYKKIPEELKRGMEFIKGFETTLSWRRQGGALQELERDGVIHYFIENDYYFGRDGYYGYGDDYERFAFFSKAAVEMAGIAGFMPHVIHANDWQTGLCPAFLRDKLRRFLYYQNVKSLFTIHNLQYQGVFGRDVLPSLDLDDGYFSVSGFEFYGCVSLLKAGISCSDAVGTVSETYAREIQTPSYGFSMDGVIRSRSNVLHGIVNGIDYEKNNPEKDKLIFCNYDAESAVQGKAANKAGLQKELNLPVKAGTPMFAVISRLTDQKGFDIMGIILDELLGKDVQLVVLGQGDARYEQMFKHFRGKYPDKCAIYLGFNDALAQKLYAAADFFLMPSLFEPCGLGQMTAMRYGTLPIARKTGGLADTIEHFNHFDGTGNGFLFEDYVASGLMWAVNQALECYSSGDNMAIAIKNAMSRDFSWEASAGKYEELYRKICGLGTVRE